MSSQIKITFNPAGFSECLQSMTDVVQAAAEGIAARAGAELEKGSGFHVEITDEPRFLDNAYGTTRPVGHVVSNDDETAAEEAEKKILSKAVSG